MDVYENSIEWAGRGSPSFLSLSFFWVGSDGKCLELVFLFFFRPRQQYLIEWNPREYNARRALRSKVVRAGIIVTILL